MLSIKEIKQITHAQIVNGEENTKIKRFNISSKNHKKDDFYIPIYWREDRHQYILDAVISGAIGYIISKKYNQRDEVIKKSMEINPNIIILEVEEINQAIYKLAMHQREKNLNIPIIAVTGSVGKTSTCEMISSIMKQERNVLSDRGNNNTKVLLSWLMLDLEEYEMAVLEAGIGDKNVMDPIAKLLRPSIVIINNIGTAHIERLGSRDSILKEKIQLTQYMQDKKIVCLNNDDDILKEVKLDDTYHIMKYSLSEAKNIEQKEDHIVFETEVYGKYTKFCILAYGIHNISNAICAIRIGELLNVKKENIQKGILEYRGVDRRFQVIKKNNYIIIDDTYNASLTSMQAGLLTANEINECKRKIAVLGEMLELGEYSQELHCKVGETFQELNFDILLTQGKNTKYICESAKKYMQNKTIVNFQNQEDLICYLLENVKEQDLIYLKASKKMNFNKIVQRLLEK